MLELEVEELISRSQQGRTHPWLVLMDNGKRYYIKGASALNKGLVVELLAAKLGKLLDLPVPDFGIAYLDDLLLRDNIEARKDFGHEGCFVFASEEVQGIMEINVSSIATLNQEHAKKLFVFDYLIKNEDRILGVKGGNPNLFINPINNDLVVVDHNLAFDPDYNFQANIDCHIFHDVWFSKQRDMLYIEELRHLLPLAIDCLHKFTENVPNEWLEREPDLIELIFTTLNLCRNDSFWEALK